MNVRTDRLARARDFVLIACGGAAFAFGFAFLAARLWFRNLFLLTDRPDPLWFALVAFAVAVMLGTLHALLPTPLPRPGAGAYKGEADR